MTQSTKNTPNLMANQRLTPMYARQIPHKIELTAQGLGTLVFLIFSLLLNFCLPMAQAVPPLWTQARQVSLGSAFSSEADTYSRGDEVYVVWSDNRTGNMEVFFIASTDAGQTWGQEERLTDTPGESSQPAIACDRKNVYVVWREKDEDASRIYYRKWDGNLWGDSLLISGGYENSKRPEIACTTAFPGSYVYIVWDSDRDGKTTAYLTRSADGGLTFSTPQPITSRDWSTRETTVWGGARDVYLAWSDNREGNWHIFFKKWGESQVGEDRKLSPLPNCHSPTVRGSEPMICAAWQCVEEGKAYADIYFSASASSGANWAAAEKLTQGEAESVFPKIAISNEEAWVFWQDGRNGEWQIFFWTANSGVQSLTSGGDPEVLLDAASTPGQIHTFWTEVESDSNASIIYMRRDTVAPASPGTPVHSDLTAAPGYDDDAQVTFSWVAPKSRDIAKYNVYSRADGGGFALVGSTESNTYSVQGESGRIYQVYVEAVDAVGNVSSPSGISTEIICDPDSPEVIIYSPQTNSTIRGTVPIIASIHDSNLLEYNVEYGITAVPSEWWHLAGPFVEELDRRRIMTWETADLHGIYTLRITARDLAANESVVKATINVDSRPPIAVSPGEAVQLTPPDVEWIYGTPAWSPDGNRIAFHSDEGGTEDIWTMLSGGQGRTRVTRNIAVEHSPAWSPSGDMIAFQSFTEDKLWDIWVMKSGGQNAKNITSDSSSDMNPVWSPDGTSIVFDSDRDGDSEIWMITNVQSVLSGGTPNLVQLTYNDWEDSNPTWSPDGSKIIFQSSRRGNWDLFQIGIDGENPELIVGNPADEIEPDWSPDRKRVLFSTNEPGDHYEIRAIDWPEAAKQVRLSPKGQDARRARWSPTMESIVYESGGSLYSAELIYPIDELEAIIYWPRGGEVLTGWADVTGIARGADFLKYSLYYAKSTSDQANSDIDLQPIGGGSTAPVPEIGFLGRWYTDGLEGEYFLKLVVTGKNGDYAEDSVRVLIANQLPFILIDEPQNGLITNKSIIDVKGRAGQRVTVTMNDREVRLNPDGSFSEKVQLSEGTNNIEIKAQSPSTQDGEYLVKRTVVLDTTPPEINLQSPVDFQVIHVPYVTIKGSVSEKAEVSILSKRAWTDQNNSFQRTISCSEGVNTISIVAFDQFGYYTSMQRRVIFERTQIISDTAAPAIADVFPDNGAVIVGRQPEISATLVDDIGLDPLSIVFSFDGAEIESTGYKLDIQMPGELDDFPLDQYPVIHLTYSPTAELAQGDHSFGIEIQDTSGNMAESTFSFSVDSIKSRAMISAELTGKNNISVIAGADRPLNRIIRASVYDSTIQQGYSLSSFVQNGDYYTTSLNISSSQRSFIMDFSAETYIGEEVNAYGYMAWDEVRTGEVAYMGVEGGPWFSSDQPSGMIGNLTLVLRSQDGRDPELVSSQQSDAEFRRLQASGLTYVLSASEELDEGEIQGILSLPVQESDYLPFSASVQQLIMFHWNEILEVWDPLDRIGFSKVSSESRVTKTGIYGLFADIEPPSIRDVFPMNSAEVPLDNFLVEANVSDRGSGIYEIRLLVDGNRVEYDYDPLTGRLVYFPSALEWGLHQIQINATDRAGNDAEFSTDFATREVFQFIRVLVYPNPADGEAKIEFKLTRVSDVKLRIYTLAGELVYRSESKNAAEGEFVWKCENSAGRKVASGIYIYFIEASLYQAQIHKQGVIAVVI